MVQVLGDIGAVVCAIAASLRDKQDQMNTPRSSGPLSPCQARPKPNIISLCKCDKSCECKAPFLLIHFGVVVAKANVQLPVHPLPHTSCKFAKNDEPPNTPPESKDAYSANSEWDTEQQRTDVMHPGSNPLSSASSS